MKCSRCYRKPFYRSTALRKQSKGSDWWSAWLTSAPCFKMCSPTTHTFVQFSIWDLLPLASRSLLMLLPLPQMLCRMKGDFKLARLGKEER